MMGEVEDLTSKMYSNLNQFIILSFDVNYSTKLCLLMAMIYVTISIRMANKMIKMRFDDKKKVSRDKI